MLASAAAVAAVSAGNVTLTGNTVADFVVSDATAHFYDFTDILVANGHRSLDGVLRPLVPIVDVKVSAADSNFPNLDKYIIYTDFRHRNIFHPDARFCILFYKCFHPYEMLIVSLNCVRCL